jgi:hypothetical protein
MSDQSQYLAQLSQEKAAKLSPKMTADTSLAQAIASAKHSQELLDQQYEDSTSSLFSTDSMGGVLGNAVVGAANSAYKGLMSIPKLASELETSWDLSGNDIQQPDLENYHRLNEISATVNGLQDQLGKATDPTQKLQLSSQISQIKGNLSQDDITFLKGDGNGTSKYAAIKEFYEDRERNQSLQKASKYFDKYVDQDKVTAAAEEFGIDFDKSAPEIMAGIDKMKKGDTLAGLGEAISGSLSLAKDTVGTAINNPEATIQVMAESAPEIYMAAKSLVMATLMAGGRSVSDNMEEWAAEHEGKIALGDERTKVMLWSAAEAITATMGDKVLASGGSIKKAITGKAAEGTKTTLKNALPKAATALAKDGTQEYIQEGAEEALSQMAVKGETDLREMHVAGGLGFAAGAGTAAAMKVREKVNNAKNNVKVNRALREEEKAAQEEVAKEQKEKQEEQPVTLNETVVPEPEEIAQEQESNKEFVETLQEEQKKQPTENTKVKELVEGITQLQTATDEMTSAKPDERNLVEMFMKTAMFSNHTNSIPDQVDELLKEDLNDTDKDTLNKIKERFADSTSDTLVNTLARTVKDSPAVQKQLDSALKYITSGSEEEAGNNANELVKAISEDTDEANALFDSLVRVKLFSADDIKSEDYSADELESLSEYVSDNELSEELVQLADAKRSMEGAHSEFKGVGGKDLEDGMGTTRRGLEGHYRQIQWAVKEGYEPRWNHNLKQLKEMLYVRKAKEAAMRKAIENGETGIITYPTSSNGKTTGKVEIHKGSEGLFEMVQEEKRLAEQAVFHAENLIKNATGQSSTPATEPVEIKDDPTFKQKLIHELNKVRPNKVRTLKMGSKLGAFMSNLQEKGLGMTYSDARSIAPASWGRNTILNKVKAINAQLKTPVLFDDRDTAQWGNIGNKTPAGSVFKQFVEQTKDIDNTFPSLGRSRSSDSFKNSWANPLTQATKMIGSEKVVMKTTENGKTTYPEVTSRLNTIGKNADILNKGKYTAEDKVVLVLPKDIYKGEDALIKKEVNAAFEAGADIILPTNIRMGKVSSTFDSASYTSVVNFLKDKGFTPTIQSGADVWVNPNKPKTEAKPTATPIDTSKLDKTLNEAQQAIDDLNQLINESGREQGTPEPEPEAYQLPDDIQAWFNANPDSTITKNAQKHLAKHGKLLPHYEHNMRMFLKMDKPKYQPKPTESFDDVFSTDGLLSQKELDAVHKVIALRDEAQADLAVFENAPSELGKGEQRSLNARKKRIVAYGKKVDKLLAKYSPEQLKQINALMPKVESKVQLKEKAPKQRNIPMYKRKAAAPKATVTPEPKTTPEATEEKMPKFDEWVQDAGQEALDAYNTLSDTDKEILAEVYPDESLDYLKKIGLHLSAKGKDLVKLGNEIYQRRKDMSAQAEKDHKAVSAKKKSALSSAEKTYRNERKRIGEEADAAMDKLNAEQDPKVAAEKDKTKKAVLAFKRKTDRSNLRAKEQTLKAELDTKHEADVKLIEEMAKAEHDEINDRIAQVKEEEEAVRNAKETEKENNLTLVERFGRLYNQAKQFFYDMRESKEITPKDFITGMIASVKETDILKDTSLAKHLATAEDLANHLEPMKDEDLISVYKEILKAVDDHGDTNLKRRIESKISLPIRLHKKASILKDKLGENTFTKSMHTIKDLPFWKESFNGNMLYNPALNESFLLDVLGVKATPINKDNLKNMGTNIRYFSNQLGKFEAKLANQFYDESPLKDLMVDGKFPPEIRTAMYMAYMRTLADVGSSKGIPNWQLAATLGVAEDDLANIKGVEKFQQAGTLMNAEIFTNRFASTMGISATPDVSASVMNDLNWNVGTLLFEMAKMDAQLESNPVVVENKTYHGFTIRNTYNDKPTYLSELKKGDDLFAKLTGSNNGTQRNYIGTPPDPVDGSYTNLRSSETYSDDAVQAENNNRSIAWEFDKELADYYYDLGEEGFKQLHGHISGAGMKRINKNLRDTYIGKNIQLIGSYRKFVEHYELVTEATEDGKYPERGYTYFASTNSSVRRAQQHGAFNPQGDKFHRALFRTVNTAPVPDTDWYSVKAGTFDSKKITAQSAFVLGLGQALGLDADKQDNSTTFDATLPVINDALRMIQDSTFVPEGEYADVLQAAFMLATVPKDATDAIKATMDHKKDPLAFHQKQGIIALAKLIQNFNPDSNEVKSFKHSLRFEIDGVTNGPHHNNLVLALGEEQGYSFMVQGGAIKGHETKGIHEIIGNDKTFKDNYQKTGEAANQAAEKLGEDFDEMMANPDVAPHAKAYHAAMKLANQALMKQTIVVGGNRADISKGIDKNKSAFTFDFSQIRNLFKNPVTVTVYGGGAGGITNNMHNGTIETFYSRLTTHALALEKNEEGAMAALEADMADWQMILDKNYAYNSKDPLNLLKEDGNKALFRDMDLEHQINYLRSFTLSPKKVDFLQDVLTNDFFGLSTVVNKGIDKNFQNNKNTAAVMNASTNLITLLANNWFKDAYTKLQAKRVKQGKIGEKQSLSKEDFNLLQRELNKILPGVKTALADDTVDIRKQDKTNQSVIAQSGKAQVPNLMVEGDKETTTSIKSSHRDFSPLGVAVIPRVIISVDANMQIKNHILQGKLGDYLNVYDAIDKGADQNLQASAEVSNMADYMAIMEADPIGAVHELFVNSIKTLKEGSVIDGDIIINPVLRKLETAEKGVLNEAFNQYRIAINNQELPLQEYMPALTQILDVDALLEFLENQLSVMKENTRKYKEHLWFSEDMTNSQMGGIDNGVARIHNGEIIFSEQASRFLSEEAYQYVETFNRRMKDRYIAYKKAQEEAQTTEPVATEAGEVWQDIKESTAADLNPLEKGLAKIRIARQFSATGKLFLEALYAHGTPTDLTNMTFTFENKEDQTGLIKLMAERGIHLDKRQKALLLNNTSNLQKMLKGLTIKIEDKYTNPLLQENMGYFDPQEGTIYLRAGLDVQTASNVLAHEMSHAMLDHELFSNIQLLVTKGIKATSATFQQHMKVLGKFNKLVNEESLIQLADKYAVGGAITNTIRDTFLSHIGVQTIHEAVNEAEKLEAALKKEPTNKALQTQYAQVLYTAMSEHMAYSLTETMFTSEAQEIGATVEKLDKGFIDRIKSLIKAVKSLYESLIPHQFKDIEYGKVKGIKEGFYSPNVHQLNREIFTTYMVDAKQNTGEFDTTGENATITFSANSVHISTAEVLEEAMVNADATGISEKHKTRLAHTIGQMRYSVRTGKASDTPTVPWVADVNKAYRAAGIPLEGITGLVYSQLAQILAVNSKEHWFSTNALQQVFNEAKSQLSPKDFLPEGTQSTDADYNARLSVAETQYAAIFHSDAKEYLTNFAALAESSEWFMNQLNKVHLKTAEKEPSANPLTRLHKNTHDMVANIGNKLAGIPKDAQAYETVRALNSNLLKEAKETNQEGKLYQAEKSLDGFLKILTKKGVKALTSLMAQVPVLKQNAQTLEDLLIDPEGEKGQAKYLRRRLIQTVLSETLTSEGKKMNALVEFLAEFFPRDMPSSRNIDTIRDEASYSLDSIREDQEVTALNKIKSAFTKKLSTKEDKALGTALRADLGTLTEEMPVDLVQELIEEPDRLNREIADLTQAVQNSNLTNKANLNLALNEAAALGYRSITGGAYKGLNLPNAYAIAKYIHTPSLETSLNQLASLYSIQAMSQEDKQSLASLLKNETEGVTTSLAIHKGVHQKLHKRSSEVAKMALPKGFLEPVQLDNTRVRIVTQAQFKTLKGFEKIRDIAVDPADPKGKPLVMVKSTEGGSLRWVQGAMNTIEQTVGNMVTGNNTAKDKGIEWIGRSNKTNSIKLRKQQVAHTQLTKGIVKPVLMKDGMLPMLSVSGEVVGYQYAITHAEQETLGNKDFSATSALAKYSARVQEETLAKKHNAKIVAALKEAYDERTSDKQFITISANSKDKQLAEIWRVTPSETKDMFKKAFGAEVIMVNKLDLNNALGYREASVVNLWDYPANSHVRRYTVELLEAFFGRDVVRKLRTAERIEQEVVGTAKDVITIRSVVVPAGNLVSNLNQLHVAGIPMDYIKRNGVNAVNGVRAYKRDMHKYLTIQLEASIEKNPNKKRKLERTLKQLNQHLQSNPVFPLVKAGLLPTVVDELSQTDTKNNLKQQLLKKHFPKAMEADSLMLDVGKELLITEDSATHKALSELMELGDFGGKYILYKWLTEEKGVLPEDALDQARKEFINYGTLTGKTQDYLNKTGGMFFFKYFQRGQAVQARRIMENPTRSLITILGLGQVMDNIFNANIAVKDLSHTTGLLDLLNMAEESSLII